MGPFLKRSKISIENVSFRFEPYIRFSSSRKCIIFSSDKCDQMFPLGHHIGNGPETRVDFVDRKCLTSSPMYPMYNIESRMTALSPHTTTAPDVPYERVRGAGLARLIDVPDAN